MIAAAAAFETPSVHLGPILPALVLTIGALLLLLVGSFESKSARVTSGVIGLVSFAGAGIATWYLWNNGDGTAFSGQLAADRYSALVQAIVCASGVASILLGWGTHCSASQARACACWRRPTASSRCSSHSSSSPSRSTSCAPSTCTTRPRSRAG
jgi:nucleoside recognition membrane protein YjiH